MKINYQIKKQKILKNNFNKYNSLVDNRIYINNKDVMRSLNFFKNNITNVNSNDKSKKISKINTNSEQNLLINNDLNSETSSNKDSNSNKKDKKNRKKKKFGKDRLTTIEE